MYAVPFLLYSRNDRKSRNKTSGGKRNMVLQNDNGNIMDKAWKRGIIFKEYSKKKNVTQNHNF